MRLSPARTGIQAALKNIKADQAAKNLLKWFQ